MVALGLGVLGLAQRVDAQAPGPYSGSAETDLVHVQALNVPEEEFQLAEAAVAPALAEMDSAGLKDGGNSHSRATNLDVDLLSGEIAANLLVEAKHRAPSDEEGPVKDTLAEIPADPLLNAKVGSASAHSRWNGAGCVPVGTPIAESSSELADANVLTGTDLGDALLAIDNSEGGTVFSKSTTDLVDVPDQIGKGVRSTALTQLTAITLFRGTENQLTINVLAPPVVEAIASGTPGKSKVTYSEPVLQVVDAAGEVLGELNAAEANFELDLSPLVILRLGHLASTVSEDGTSATGRATMLEVIVLNEPGATEPLARLTIAGGEAKAKAPSGGVACAGTGATVGGIGEDDGECGTANPLSDLSIVSSEPSVSAGSTFTYTINVSNNGDCTLENVRVEETIDGPPGSTVTATDPEADSVDGLNVVWNDVGPLEPGASKVLTVTVAVSDNAGQGGSFSSDVKANANAGGEAFEQTASVQGPTVEATEVAVGGESLPRSGTYIGTLVAIALSLIGAGEFLRRRSRSRLAQLDS
jgi:uncharacterized repeat protein (TIGR01451 family)